MIRRSGYSSRGVLLGLLLVLLPFGEWVRAADELSAIRVRKGEHLGYSRIVFDWTRT